MKMTVAQIADKFNVTEISVRNWIKDGLPYEVEKVIGVKPRMIIDPNDVEKYHKSKVNR